jgi:hypothetical protein
MVRFQDLLFHCKSCSLALLTFYFPHRESSSLNHYFLFLSVLLPILCSASFAADGERKVSDAIFKITATVRHPDFLSPWNKSSPVDVSGTGFLVEGNRVLTNYHVIRYASQIYVQPDGSDQAIKATVEYFSSTVDLAILKLVDESMLMDRAPLEFSDGFPIVRSEVAIYGYPIGGDQLSVTKGIVSRIEFRDRFLNVQIDAAINHGNSGGPAIHDGKVIGVAYAGPLVFESGSLGLSVFFEIRNKKNDMLSFSENPLMDFSAWREFADHELVVVPQIPSSHHLMQGYGRVDMYCVKEVDNIPVRNIKHLVEIFRDNRHEFVEITFHNNGAGILAFNREEFMNATEEVLAESNIRNQFSKRLQAVWENK